MRPRERSRLVPLIAPWLTGLGLLVALPAALSVALAFTRYDALSPPVFVGLGNFRDLFRDDLFHRAVRNSITFVLLAVPLRLLGALALALALERPRRGVGPVRLAVFFPAVVPDVAYALLWTWLLNPLYGPINLTLRALGLPAPEWLAGESTALPSLVLMALFQIGEGFVVLLAGLQAIPHELHQAAALEGAGRWGRFRWITLPLLAPWFVLLTVRDVILSAQSTFSMSYVATEGGPYYATLFLPLLAHQEAFTALRFGTASAIVLLQLAGAGLLIVLVHLAVRGRGYGDEA